MRVSIEIVARGYLDNEVNEDDFDKIKAILAKGSVNLDNFASIGADVIVQQDLLDFLQYEVVAIEPATAEEEDDGKDT